MNNIKLPRQELLTNKEFFEKHIENLVHLKTAIEIELNKFSSDVQDKLDFKYCTLMVQHDEICQKIKTCQLHLEVYSERLADYEKIYNRETEECVAGWNDVYDRAKEVVRKNPQSMLSLVLKDFDPQQASQELRNHVFKSMVSQLKSYDAQKKDGKGNIVRM